MSIEHSEAVNQLISQFAKMPGIGHKTAQRLTFYILKITEEEAKALANAILAVKEKVHYCSKCFGITEVDPCPICQSDKRDNSTICIVEEASDIVAIEKTKEYKGLYHVLHGVLSPLDGIGPDDLRLKELLERIQSNISNIKEIIIATNPNVEGEATAMYIVKLIKPLGIKVTRIARGLPVGGDLEFADKVTLSRALEGRKEM